MHHSIAYSAAARPPSAGVSLPDKGRVSRASPADKAFLDNATISGGERLEG